MKSFVVASSVSVAMGWSYLRHMQLPIGPSRVHWGGMVFGHRGCRGVPGIPENTLDAFKYAASRGCDGIECDVRLTKDNEIVVFHDSFSFGQLRELPQKQRIDELTLFQLKECSFAADPTEQIRVPTLEESILFCKENNLRMIIEVKELRKWTLCTDKVLDLYRRYPDYMYEQTTLASFHPGVIYHTRRQDRGVAVCQLYTDNLIESWIVNVGSSSGEIPRVLQLCPRVWDWVLMAVQEKIMPWVAGCSMVGPRFHLYTEAYRRRWLSRKIGVYLWGYQSSTECTPAMRVEGVCVAADDQHEAFQTPKPPPDFDIFGDRQREMERQQEEAHRRLRLGKE